MECVFEGPDRPRHCSAHPSYYVRLSGLGKVVRQRDRCIATRQVRWTRSIFLELLTLLLLQAYRWGVPRDVEIPIRLI